MPDEIPIYRPAPYLSQQPAASTTRAIADDVLADLRWMADTPQAIVTMPKSVLRILLDTYERHGGLRVVGSLDGIAGG